MIRDRIVSFVRYIIPTISRDSYAKLINEIIGIVKTSNYDDIYEKLEDLFADNELFNVE